MANDDPVEIRRLLPLTEQSFCCFQSQVFVPGLWHFHNYYEIFVLKCGKLRWRIGKHSGKISAGELIVVGPNLGHTFYLDDAAMHIHSIGYVIMFKLPENSFVELSCLSGMLEDAIGGLRVSVNESTLAKIVKLTDQRGVSGLSLFFEILCEIDKASGRSLLGAKPSIKAKASSRSEKLDKLTSYLENNFLKEISLREIGEYMNMSVSGVCAFFSKTTKMTVIDFIHRLRISFACQKLRQTNLPVSWIAHECGYNSLSSFNRMFRKFQNNSPLKFRKEN